MLGGQTKSIMVCCGIFWSGQLFTAISRNVVGKNVHATIPKGIVGGFERMAGEAMDTCLRVLQKSNKTRFDRYSR